MKSQMWDAILYINRLKFKRGIYALSAQILSRNAE
jgi:hypothetical protein